MNYIFMEKLHIFTIIENPGENRQKPPSALCMGGGLVWLGINNYRYVEIDDILGGLIINPLMLFTV